MNVSDRASQTKALVESLGGSVMVLDDRTFRKRVYDGFSSGSLMLNLVLTGRPGIGYVSGRIYEIYGPEGSGKTTLGLHAVAAAQKAFPNKRAGFCDAEHSFDSTYAASIGVRLDELLFQQPDSGEQALQIVEAMCSTSEVSVAVIDSVAALVPQAELDGDIGDAHIGLQARLMSQAMRKLASVANRTGTCVIFINQIREKVGVTWGSSETTPGGRALRFYASVRMDVRAPRMGKLSLSGSSKKSFAQDGVEESEEGTKLVVTVKKNKLFPPFKKARLSIFYGKGIDKKRDLLAVGLYTGIVTKLTDKEFVYRNTKRSIAKTTEDQFKAIRASAKKVLKEAE